ncbi:hypothetical protein N2W54_000756 [Lotmaria passim]
MFRVVGRRFGGRVGKAGGSSLLQAGTTAAAASKSSTATSTVSPTAAALREVTSLVDVVLPRVDCSLLKHIISSSSSSSTSTDIPDSTRVLRLDYSSREAHGKRSKKGADAATSAVAANGGVVETDMTHPLADILLVNRIHAAVVEDTKRRALKGEADVVAAVAQPSSSDGTAKSSAGSLPPLLVLVETSLSQEDAEVQQFILRNALRMHPLPPTVEVPQPLASPKKKGSAAAAAVVASLPPLLAATPPLVVLVLSAELTERVRTLARLPPPPSPMPAAPTRQLRAAAMDAQTPALKSATAPSAAAAVVPDQPATASAAPQSPLVEIPPPPPKPIDVTFPAAKTVSKEKESSSKKKVATALSRTKAHPQRSATALLRQHAAGKLQRLRNNRHRIVQRTHKHMQQPQSRSKAVASASKSALAPRLLSVDDKTEKLLWTSAPGHPLPLTILAPLIRPAIYAQMCVAAASRSVSSNTKSTAGADSPLALHVVVYRAGSQSSAQTVWLGAVQAATELAVALSRGRSQLPAVITELAAQSHAALTVDAPHPRRRAASTESSRGAGKRTSPPRLGASSTTVKAAAEAPFIYMLIHTSLSPQDAAVLQQELDYHHLQLKSTPAGAEIAGVAVLTTQDVSPTQLWYVLENSAPRGRDAMTETVAATVTAASPRSETRTAAPQGQTTLARGPVSPEGVEASRVFHDVYKLLTEQPELLGAPFLSSAAADEPSSTSSEDARTSGAGIRRHPDALVSDALRIAALAQVLVQRKEAQLREEFAAVQQRSAASADSEAVARAAQKAEMKTMVTEAVEEVSVRHEQATAHLVKTLSSMVGQWSLEKLSDTLEAIMRDEVKPIMDVLEERLGSVTTLGGHGAASSATSATRHASTVGHDSAEHDAAMIEGGTATSTPNVDAAAESFYSPPPPYREQRTDNDEVAALVEGQGEVKETLEQVLGLLRNLSERVAALAETAAAHAPPVSENTGEAETWTLNAQHAADEDRLVQTLRDLQQQHQVELQEALATLKEELQSARPASGALAAAVSDPVAKAGDVAMSTGALESAVSRAMDEVSLTIRQSVQNSIVQQLDSYCEVHRNSHNHRSSSSNSGGNENGSGYGQPSLPVTSFELEEMLTRTVNFAVREASNELEGHVRAAMEKALQSHVAAVTTSAPSSASSEAEVEDGNHVDKNSSKMMKAALEELWAQVKAEAAEEEAVKLSQHNRQLHRLFRRQQHLQKTSNHNSNNSSSNSSSSAAASEAGLTIVAVEEAVRAAMHPYVAQMRAALTAASAAAASRAEPRASSAPSYKEE